MELSSLQRPMSSGRPDSSDVVVSELTEALSSVWGMAGYLVGANIPAVAAFVWANVVAVAGGSSEASVAPVLLAWCWVTVVAWTVRAVELSLLGVSGNLVGANIPGTSNWRGGLSSQSEVEAPPSRHGKSSSGAVPEK